MLPVLLTDPVQPQAAGMAQLSAEPEDFYLKVSAALLARDLSLVLSFFHATCDLHLPVPYYSFLEPHFL